MANTNQFIEQKKAEFDLAIEHFKKEISSLRTGRAQSTLVENVMVEAYGSQTPLKQLASISVPEAKSISIEPWDKNLLKEIEKALNFSNLGLSIVNAGNKIITKVPLMTEENRKGLLKVLSQKLETAKISIRQIRDKVKESILAAEKNKEITQDDRYKYAADLDNYVTDINKKLESITKEKEEEIMTI
jgi:ribosome recycling factor